MLSSANLMERRELQLAGWDQGANEKWMARVHEQCTPDAQGNLVRGYIDQGDPIREMELSKEEERLP